MKNKQLLLTVAITGLFGVSSMAFSEISKRTGEAVEGMVDNHFKKTVLGGYLTLSGLYKMSKGIYGYPYEIILRSTKKTLEIQGEIYSTNSTVAVKDKFLKNVRSGSIGTVVGSSILAYAFCKSFPPKN